MRYLTKKLDIMPSMVGLSNRLNKAFEDIGFNCQIEPNQNHSTRGRGTVLIVDFKNVQYGDQFLPRLQFTFKRDSKNNFRLLDAKPL